MKEEGRQKPPRIAAPLPAGREPPGGATTDFVTQAGMDAGTGRNDRTYDYGKEYGL